MYTVIVLYLFRYETIVTTDDEEQAKRIRDNLINKFGSNAIVIDHNNVRTMCLITSVVLISLAVLGYMST